MKTDGAPVDLWLIRVLELLRTLQIAGVTFLAFCGLMLLVGLHRGVIVVGECDCIDAGVALPDAGTK